MATVYNDIDLNLNIHPVTGDVTVNKGDLAVLRSIENLVQLNHFDIPFHSDIGTNVTFLLFENFSPTTSRILEKELTDTIRNYEPRATINYLNVDADPDRNGYNVTISAFINNNTEAVTVSAFLERLR